eukprot:4855115-Pyramimonas_sp.AAC.1
MTLAISFGNSSFKGASVSSKATSSAASYTSFGSLSMAPDCNRIQCSANAFRICWAWPCDPSKKMAKADAEIAVGAARFTRAQG